MAVLLSRLGAFSHRHRVAVVLVWLLVLVGGGVGAGTLAGETSDSFAIPGQESTTALERISEEFGAAGGATAQVVVVAPEGQTLTTPQSAAAVGDAGVGALPVEVTGQAIQAPPHVGGPAEVIGVVVALVVLAVTYGSLVVAGLNLLTALVGVGIGVLGITVATGFTGLSSTTPILAAMLGLAVGIDYALFIVSRFRQELRRGADVATAVATAVVAVLVALTLVPAALGFLGLRALPRRQRGAAPTNHAASQGFLAGWVTAVTRHRVVALLLTVLALGTVAVPFFSMQTTLVQTPPEDSTQARAQQLLADGFGAGSNGPLTVLFEGDGAVQAATTAAGEIPGLDDVAIVTPPVPSPDGTAALVSVIPQSGPTDQATEQLVTDLRDLLADTDGAQASVTGATAVSVDVATSLDAALPVYLALVVGLALVLLVLVFRSLLVPLVGVLGFVLTVGAALGATVAVFQWGWLADLVNLEGTGPLISLTPILVIGILFGLAMDYQIFLVSRMHEAHSHGVAPLEAVRTGFRQAAPVVVAAALIMFSVFAGFVPSGDATIKSIAFALAAGIAFDAFVVRMVLVPAALALLGDRAWWLPRWLRWLPTLDVEGAALERPAGRPQPRPLPEVVGAGERCPLLHERRGPPP